MIHLGLIEEMYYLSKAELEDHLLVDGQQAVFEANWVATSTRSSRKPSSAGSGTARATGRTCSSTRQVVHLAGIMAAELGASTKTAKRVTLHDLGKAMTHEVEGSHALISAQWAKRYGESQGVVHAIEAHHYEVQPQTVEAVLLIGG